MNATELVRIHCQTFDAWEALILFPEYPVGCGAALSRRSAELPKSCNLSEAALISMGFELLNPIDEVTRGAVMPPGWNFALTGWFGPYVSLLKDERRLTRAYMLIKTQPQDYRGFLYFSGFGESHGSIRRALA